MESEPLINEDLEDKKATTADHNALLGGKEAPKFTQKTVLGEIRNWKRFSWLEWAFVVVAVVSILGVLGMTTERLVHTNRSFRNITQKNVSENETEAQLYSCNNWTCTNDFIFAIVVILNLVFCSVYAMDGLLREKMYEMIGYAVALAVIMIYVIGNYSIKQDEMTSPYRLTRLVLVLIGGPINILLSCLISYRMGFLIFHIVGSNDRLIRAYNIRSSFLTLQYFLLQVMANILTLLWSGDGHFISVAEKVILCLLLAFCLLVLPIGWAAVLYENPWLVYLWYLTLAPYYSLFVYEIVHVSVRFQDVYNTSLTLGLESGSEYISFIYIAISIIVASIIGLAVLALLYTFMALSHRNFKKGLKEKVPPPVDLWQWVQHRYQSRTSSESSQQ